LRKPSRSDTRRLWGCCAIALGAWEASAFATGRVPTVTEACRRARTRRVGTAAVLIWWLGLGHHLMRSKRLDP
jgi:hypothetical protein